MPRSPSNLTVASFLRNPHTPSPPPKRKRGKKRCLISPTPLADTPPPKKAISITKSKTKSNSDDLPMASPQIPMFSPTNFPPLTPPHPPQSETDRNPTPINSTVSSPSLPNSRMDSELLAMDSNEIDEIGQCPTWEEAEALLREDPPPSVSQSQPQATTDANSPSDPGSPTAAVKSAIEAQIAEEMLTEISHFAENPKSKRNSVTDANKDSATSLPWPLLPPNPPLFSQTGYPPSCKQRASLRPTQPTQTRPKPMLRSAPPPRRGRWLTLFYSFTPLTL